MKEEKTKKRKIFYYVALMVSVCLLTAATVLTVYFVSDGGRHNMLEEKPETVQPAEPEKPDKEPDKPTGGEAEKFSLPLSYSGVSVYNDIYASKTTGFIYRHQGVDFAAAEGTKVSAICEGRVEKISLSEKTGNVVTVNHGNGLIANYRFVEPDSALKVGSVLEKGQSFATVAAAYGSEAKDGTHLHLEMELNGKAVDPAAYLNIQYEEK